MNSCKKSRPYFEGWYFKHQLGNKIIAFIPGINQESGCVTTAFLQIIASDSVYQLTFPIKECCIDSKACYIRLGKNVFTKDGILLDIHTAELTIKGTLLYRNPHPIAYSIMGCFRYLPLMECKHEVISMSHRITGTLLMQGESISFDKAVGYIEKDWGHSFPKSYLWLQCNDFYPEKCSIMLSLAHIPLWGMEFTGCICAIHYRGNEYRIATYLGVMPKKTTPEHIVLKQGDYCLNIRIIDASAPVSYALNAPDKGKMNRTIKESHLCKGVFTLKQKDCTIFNLKSNNISYEYVP